MGKRGHRKVLVGTVASDKMDKTVVVQVTRRVMHPMYKKYIRQHNRFKAHDPENKCRVGDTVRIIEARPLSKEKRWRVQEIIERVA